MIWSLPGYKHWILKGLVAGIVCAGAGWMGDGYAMYTVISSSMVPTLRPGSLVVVRSSNKVQYREGDIVVFEAPISGNPLVIHRITQVEQQGGRVYVLTKGDANTNGDLWEVPLEAIQGQEVIHVPYLGRVIEFEHTQSGFFVVSLILLFLIIRTCMGSTSRGSSTLPPAEAIRL